MDQAERLRRNDIGKTKRLDLDHIKSPHSLVPMREVADLFVAEEAAKERQAASAAFDAELRFYKRLAKAVSQREFEGRTRLFVVDGVVVRWNRQSAAFIGKAPADGAPDREKIDYWRDIIAAYLSKTRTPQWVAFAWCAKHKFTVPQRWAIATKTPNARRNRLSSIDPKELKRAVYELMDHHGDFVRGDPEWNAQARLEVAIRSRFDSDLTESRIRALVKPHLDSWRDLQVR